MKARIWNLPATLFLLGVGNQLATAQTGEQMMAIPQAAGGCKGIPQPRPEVCARWVCLTGDNSWEDIPLRAGTACNKTGRCNGIDTNVCYTSSTGTIYPAYYIASVLYVPPGAGSSVDYGAGSTIGTTTSTTNSWKNAAQVTVSAGADFLGTGGQLGFTFGNDFGGSTQTSIDVQGTVSTDMRVPAPQSDTINHNFDQIMLILGPQVDVTVTQGNGQVDQIQWAMDLSKGVPQVVLVGWLNGAMTLPANVAATLAQFGITAKDYPQILQADPFASDAAGKTKPDPTRFTYSTVMPYEPISGQYTYKTNNNYTASTTETTSVNYTVGASVSASILGQSLKASDSFTWGNTSSAKNSTGTTDTATLAISMPSAAYTGPTDLYVYVDTVYKTFLLSFLNPSGTMTSRFAKKK